MEYVVEGSSLLDQVVDLTELGQRLCRDCKAHGLSREDAINRGRWWRLIKDG